jgi:lipid-binding SYLF domain-containing protein
MIALKPLFLGFVLATSSLTMVGLATPAAAQSAETLNAEARATLDTLEQNNPAAAAIAKHARAVLVFPKIVKAGFIFGGAYGEGVLIRGSKVDGYYNSVAASWGFQAGVESSGYAVFLMTRRAESYLARTHGWEIGVGPNVVVVNKGVGQNLSTSTLKDNAYAFIFDQKGLMLDVSIEGTKISEIHPKS